MDINAQLSLAVQSFAELSALCAPPRVRDWLPTPEQRQRYVELCEIVIAALDRLLILESRALYAEGKIQSFVPADIWTEVRSHLMPGEADLWAALDYLDPDGAFLRELMAAPAVPSTGGKLRRTFLAGIEQVEALIARTPDTANDPYLAPQLADEFLSSKLIQFEPDAWVDRLRGLTPVRTNVSNLDLPFHVRLRLKELIRTYSFGCWLATLSLGRATLEYALLDNASRHSIETRWPADREGRRKGKRLSDLIDEYAQQLPGLAQAMTRIRELGNDYLHPNASVTSKKALFGRQQDADDMVFLLCWTVEEVYASRRVP
jgi:hypothetical protein